MKSNSASNVRSPTGMDDVVSPRAETYKGTCAHSGSNGLNARRSLPITWVYMCSVSRVSRHSSYGSAGQSFGTRGNDTPAVPHHNIGSVPLQTQDTSAIA